MQGERSARAHQYGDEPVPTLISLFRRSARMMVDELVRRLDAVGYRGITPSAHLLFESLPPDGARLTALATRMGMTHQAAGELVSDLERRGYLVRHVDPDDRRARLVTLSAAGADLVRVALREIGEIERSWSARLADAGLSGDLQAALRGVLEPPGGSSAVGRRPTGRATTARR
ncbi:MarR family winged helix-turn-helix transcriptional regulator [Pseudonocardia sp. KRD291]|uniref:MarR family winged helix-turn-helix transcriptional regulator n=1 Tax=Pseudonocardia sp. KRD291 TaxID=2792007 RepID=UPI001C4A54C9|nr:MarR family transcriptional regulator [Pseudonocardia sp. KRD291]MBW0101770.1 winged helix DNA-binding protein [Pseudonocardia sp. KRD291]